MREAEREKEFAAILQDVTRRAREAGNYITGEEVFAAFAPMGLDKRQMDEVFSYLREKHIGVDEEPESTAFLSRDEADSLAVYLESLSHLPSLNDGELTVMTRMAMAGDRDASHSLTEHYLPLVADIARLYSGQGVLLEDLIGEGNEALFRSSSLLGALEHPDEAESLLTASVMDAMEALIEDTLKEKNADIKAVKSVQEVADKAAELSAGYRRKITVGELADETGWDIKKITEALRLSGGAIEDIGEWEGDKSHSEQ